MRGGARRVSVNLPIAALKGQPDESDNKRLTWRERKSPGRLRALITFSFTSIIWYNQECWTNVGACVRLPLIIWMNGRIGDVGGFSFEVKSDFIGFLLLCFDADWLACLVTFYTYLLICEVGTEQRDGARGWGEGWGSCQRNVLLYPSHLGLHGQHTNTKQFPTKLPAGVAVEMEGKRERTEGAKVIDHPHLVFLFWLARSGWNNTRSRRRNKITLKTTCRIMSGSLLPLIFHKQIISEKTHAFRLVARQSSSPNYLFGETDGKVAAPAW